MATRKTAIVAAVLVGACGGSQTLTMGASSDTPVVEASYECASGSIVVSSDRAGSSLLDRGHDELVRSSWSSSDTDHFVVLTRPGNQGHPVAIEYLVPRDRSGSATLITYDRANGASFKVIATESAWRIYGDSSSTSACPASDVASAVTR